MEDATQASLPMDYFYSYQQIIKGEITVNPINKKPPGAKGIPQPFNRQAGHAPQIKPVVAQPKIAASTQSVKRPIAPPAFRPQATPKAAVQPKMANSAVNRKPPVAPPIYRPQQVPRVLQTKSATAQSPQAGQKPRHPVAPPIYRSGEKKLVQPKAISQVHKSATAPPVYRPEQKRTVQPKMASSPSAHTPPKAPPVYRAQPKQVAQRRILVSPPAPQSQPQKKAAPTAPALVGNRQANGAVQPKLSPPPQRRVMIARPNSVVQRMNSQYLNEEGLLPDDAEDLNGFAQSFNKAYSGQLESRHTQAVTVDEDSRVMLHTQRWMGQMGEVSLPDPIELRDEDIVIGDQRDDENIHAEMLAISWYLQGKCKVPQQIGVSKPVCARCSVVLSYFNIPHFSEGEVTKNWTSPWRHANQQPPIALKGRIPEIVKKGKEHAYEDTDWQ